MSAISVTASEDVTARFPVRHMDFDFTDVDKYFYAGEPAMSCFLAAMQSLFPDGEQFFIDSVRHFRQQVDNLQLQKDISAFIGQEAMHGKEHRKANDVITSYGIDVETPVHLVAALWNALNKRVPARSRLALTASLEHFTAVMGTAMLRNRAFVEAIDDYRLQQLIRWHAIEECEHKSVAFDTYINVGGNYLERAVVMVLATVGVALVFTGSTVYFMRGEGQSLNWRSWLHMGKTLFGRRGLFQTTVGEYLAWYRPGFHPQQQDTRALEAYWKKQLSLD